MSPYRTGKASHAQRTVVPVTQLALSFDAGYAADGGAGAASEFDADAAR
jgi:hypothetical protein